MSVKLSTSLKQNQSLRMTKKLQQAIKLLTLNHLDMTNAIDKEMIENPILEEISVDDNKNEMDYKVESLEEQHYENIGNEQEILAEKKEDIIDWERYIDSYNATISLPSTSVKMNEEHSHIDYENIISKKISLREHLENQLRVEEIDEIELSLGLNIIHNIDDDGRFVLGLDKIIEIVDIDIDFDKAKHILDMIQNLDPIGCGAKNLEDCLLIQSRAREESSCLLEKLIRDHLVDLKNKDYRRIEKMLGVKKQQVIEMEKRLSNYYPRPGRLISSDETQYIIPDIYIIEVAGEFVVQVNNEGMPKLRISKTYQDILKKKDSPENKEAKNYISEKLKNAIWLIRSIDRRQRTIEKVAAAILRRQQNFFRKGVNNLIPMILKDIANEIGLHESTVSRVTSNKYMDTPIGIFELKFFFSSGIGNNISGENIVPEVLKTRILNLIENENPKSPLSDQKIANILCQNNVEIARRTIAKYRELLGIVSSSKRKTS